MRAWYHWTKRPYAPSQVDANKIDRPFKYTWEFLNIINITFRQSLGWHLVASHLFKCVLWLELPTRAANGASLKVRFLFRDNQAVKFNGLVIPYEGSIDLRGCLNNEQGRCMAD